MFLVPYILSDHYAEVNAITNFENKFMLLTRATNNFSSLLKLKYIIV